MTETMILITLLSMAAGALLMSIAQEIAEAVWKRQARKRAEQEKAWADQRHKAIIREITRKEV